MVGGDGLLRLLLGRLDGDQGHHLALDLLHLHHHLPYHFVSLVLVIEVELGKGEGSNPGKDDEGHGVEPGADVGDAPQAEAELDGVHHVVNQEQAAQLGHGRVHLLGDALGVGLHVLRGDGHWHSRHTLKWIRARRGFAQHNHNFCVQLHGANSEQEQQREVGHHVDQGVVAQGHQGH